MFRAACLAFWTFLYLIPAASAGDSIDSLPLPVASFARQFSQDCAGNGLGHVVVNENYVETDGGRVDLNNDGAPDYLVYKCMFGCSKKPFAFNGIGTPCGWGKMLLSRAGQYDEVFLPGMVSQIKAGPPLRISLQRPRALRLSGNYCNDPYPDYDARFVYELRGNRFQLLGKCRASPGNTCLESNYSASGL